MYMEKTTETKATFVREDGTTTCCNAYTSIFEDDHTEYCKSCFEGVLAHIWKGDPLYI